MSGVKAEHVDTPLIARDKILLTSHVYSFNLCGTLRPSLIRLHGMSVITHDNKTIIVVATAAVVTATSSTTNSSKVETLDFSSASAR